MESQREIEKKYNKLIQDVAEKDFFKIDLTKRVNCYRCACGHVTKTKDVDPGVTPFVANCEKCGGYAYSTGYVDIAPGAEPTIEWFRPSLREVLKMRNKPAMLNHIFCGGLDSRIIPTK